jgi:hypothetical protein
MGTLNNVLGFNLTNEDPLTVSPFDENVSLGYVVPPPGSFYMITETGLFMLTEDGINLMITE